MRIPEDLKYTNDHEWVRVEDGRARIGITDYAQDALGDVVYVDLPDVGDHVDISSGMGEVESTKSVSDLYAPVSGTVVEVNSGLDTAPGLLNSDPYGEGWLCTVQIEDPAQLETLLEGSAYADLTGENT
jgi:glycine cleavage system H protein